MPKAIWKGAILAESDETIVVEGNHYFPPNSINRGYFVPSAHHTTCPWKGQASYYTVVVGDASNDNAAWYYPHPKPAAREIRDYIAFWHGVKVVDSDVHTQTAETKSSSRPHWWQRIGSSPR